LFLRDEVSAILDDGGLHVGRKRGEVLRDTRAEAAVSPTSQVGWGDIMLRQFRISWVYSSTRERERAGAIGRVPMTPRETTTLVFELAFATALALGTGEILHSTASLPMQLALPLGEFVWGLVVFYFVS
jgi:hypothetical protein